MLSVKLRFMLVALIAFLLMPAVVSAEYSYASSCPWSFQMKGTIPDNRSAVLFPGPDTSENGSLLNPGDTFIVTGEIGRFCQVISDEETGYVLKSDLELYAVSLETAVPEAVPDSLALEDPLPFGNQWQYLAFSGELFFPAPTESLFLFLWDENSFSLEKTYSCQMEEPLRQAEGSVLDNLINVNQLKSGRKTLVIQGYADGNSFVAARLYFTVRGSTEDSFHITELCRLSVPWVLTDYSVYTGWQPDLKEPSLTIDIPDNLEAGLLTLEWNTPPDSFDVVCSDKDGNTLFEKNCSTGFYLDSLELNRQISSICITPAGKECVLCTVRVYPEQYAEYAVQKWKPLPEKVDLMLFSAHEDDEFLFFGGMIPYYSAVGKTVAVVYMTDCGRGRYREALDGLWTAGLKYHPVFLGWENGTDEMLSGLDTALYVWSRDSTPDPLLDLVRLIRTYRPDIVVTHDFNGEYGHFQHRLTAVLIEQAVSLSGNPDYDPDGGLPAWTVKKLYIHLYEENQVILDWNKPLNEDYNVFTPLFLATEAYDKHQSQRNFFSMEKEGILYDNRCFGLYCSTVGEDILKNDLFENIP